VRKQIIGNIHGQRINAPSKTTRVASQNWRRGGLSKEKAGRDHRRAKKTQTPRRKNQQLKRAGVRGQRDKARRELRLQMEATVVAPKLELHNVTGKLGPIRPFGPCE